MTKLYNPQRLEVANLLFDLFGYDLTADAECPECPSEWVYRQPDTVESAIQHLNDRHHWSFERIAQWVEQQLIE